MARDDSFFSFAEEKTEPLSPSLIDRIRNFLAEIEKFIDLQPTLNPDEVKQMKHEVIIAREELDVAVESISEKVKTIEKFLQAEADASYYTYTQ